MEAWYRETHPAEIAAQAVETTDSVDIPIIEGDAPAQTVSNEHGTVTIDCAMMTYDIHGAPGGSYMVSMGSEAPIGFTMDDSGTHSAYWPLGPFWASHLTNWAVSVTMPDGSEVNLLAGEIDCS